MTAFDVSGVKLAPYWWEDAPRAETPEAPVPEKADVAVVGAGYAGLSAALVLARAGRSVQVFEKDRPGDGASSRNGGIASGNIKTPISALADKVGLDRALELYREGVEARASLKAFVEDEAIDCRFQVVGRFDGCYRLRHYEAKAREAELLRKHLGIEAHMVPRSEQHAEIGTDLYHGGMVRPDIAGVHPGLLHSGIQKKALEAGVVVHSRTSVVGVRRDGDGFEVETDRGRLSAGRVVVCTNGYTDAALAWLKRRVLSIPSQIVATEPLPPETMKRLMPKGRMLGETRHVYNYFRPSPDGTRIIFGGRAGAQTHVEAAKFAHLRRYMLEVFPELENVRITHAWWGFTGYTIDMLPHIQEHEGVLYATGFCGSGVVWARWAGVKAAQRILGHPDAASAFDREPFPTHAAYRGNPWFLPALVKWYELRDRFGI